eukprot:3756167-Alexandrium_andersonii.AAC.1
MFITYLPYLCLSSLPRHWPRASLFRPGGAFRGQAPTSRNGTLLTSCSRRAAPEGYNQRVNSCFSAVSARSAR